MLDYLMFQDGIDVKEFKDEIYEKIIYNSKISKSKDNKTIIAIQGDNDEN